MRERYFECQKFEKIQYRSEMIEEYCFVECEFTNCTFEECKLLHCTFSNCIFDRCTIRNLKAERSQIQFAQFTECRLSGVHWSELLPSGRFAEPISNLQNCRLKYNTFTDMNFKKFDFSNCDISDSMFAQCQMNESSFKGCKLDRTEFYKCDIRKADFQNASGYQIDLATNQLAGARFSYPEVLHLLDGLGIKIE